MHSLKKKDSSCSQCTEESFDLSEIEYKSEDELQENIRNVKKYMTSLKEASDHDEKPCLVSLSSDEEREIELKKQEKAKQYPVENVESLKKLHQIELQMHKNNIDFLTMKKVFHLDYAGPEYDTRKRNMFKTLEVVDKTEQVLKFEKRQQIKTKLKQFLQNQIENLGQNKKLDLQKNPVDGLVKQFIIE